MTVLLGFAGLLIVLLVCGWWLSWLATRLDRAHARVEGSWAVLDAELVRRATKAAELARAPGVDLARVLLVRDATAAALALDLSLEAREQVESALSHVLDLAALGGLELEQDRVTLARRLHNDAVCTARMLRRRPVVRAFRLAGGAAQPRPFEMAHEQQLVWSGGEQW